MKTPQELREDMQATIPVISNLIEQIEQSTSKREEQRLVRKLHELQYLQLWRVDLLQSLGEEISDK
ncbi:hypothetical protein JCM14036_30570 [Desulfotomaculum defluvii]